MHPKSLILLILPAWLLCSVSSGFAGQEVEPNNALEKATQVSVKEEISGSINDSADFYRILLPSPASIKVLLENLPADAEIDLALYGFSPNPHEERTVCRAAGETSVRCRVDATERSGYISVKTTFGPKVCEKGWCGARLSNDGPYITMEGENVAPAQHNTVPVMLPPEYTIQVQHPSLSLDRPGKQSGVAKTLSHLPSFAPEAWPCSFHYPKNWSMSWLRTDKRVLLQPRHAEEKDIRLEIERKPKLNSPGSSAEGQLNLAERDLEVIGGIVRQREKMWVANQWAPYLVAILRATDKKGGMKLFGHLQLVFEFGDDYIWLSYRTLADDYGRYLPAIQTVLDSLREKDLFSPEQSKTTEKNPGETKP